jgi:hypothetical protein
MQRHKFIKYGAPNYNYNLMFNKKPIVPVILPAPALFDYQSKGRYYIYEREVHEYNAAVEAARLAEEAAQRASTSYYSDYYPGYRW